MSRPSVRLLLLLLGGAASALLVARVTPDFDRRVVTRFARGPDPLLTAALLRFNVSSLLDEPSRYFRPPFLFPDPNPLRGTEPLVAEAALAVPFRLVLGDRPAPVFTLVRLVTLGLLVVFTGLMLGELGARTSLAVLGGCLSVLVGTTATAFDRLQAVSFQWLPLGLLFAVRFFRSGRLRDAVAFGACAFLLVQSSLYSTVMLLAVVPFLVPLLATLRGAPEAGRRRAVGLAVAAALAAFASAIVLWPYLRDRADMASFATAAYASVKVWEPAFVVDLLSTPAEYRWPGWPLAPPIGWSGRYPGGAFVLLLGAVALLALADRLRRRADRSPRRTPEPRAFRVATTLRAASLPGLVAALAWGLLAEGSAPARAAADLCLWVGLIAWGARLALWPSPWRNDEGRLAIVTSAVALAAVSFLLLSFGSGVAFASWGPTLAGGLFGPLSAVMTPLRELRELKRFLVPAGWTAVVALTLALERELRRRPRWVAPLLAGALLAIGMSERVRADVKSLRIPPVPGEYGLAAASHGRGGLLELPFDGWGSLGSIHRMLWQPVHGRPIVAGRTGLDPGWYALAYHVLNEFPSEESVLLCRAWGVDTVFDTRAEEWDGDRLARPLPPGLVFRTGWTAPGGRRAALLFDLLQDATLPVLGEEPSPGPGTSVKPTSAPGLALAIDDSLDSAAPIDGPLDLTLGLGASEAVTAVELDFGPGRHSRVPPSLRVLGRVGEEWRDLTRDPSGERLRARVADHRMKRRPGRLVVLVEPTPARALRLVAGGVRWDLPEVRVRVAPAPRPASGPTE